MKVKAYDAMAEHMTNPLLITSLFANQIIEFSRRGPALFKFFHLMQTHPRRTEA